ncbi:patatin-like phospholipase family protein [Sphingomonas sp.]|uniref:patatin-like phospholipase family protein n=1 Tax=Sphingomonas sp. TaxID=28214 RepID=UPI0025D625DD|nr:patatin-like phospholipase family protein [Sphingomonas sp.]
MTDTPAPPPPKFDKADLGQIVLVLQGGGALGAYQAGVFQAMHEAGIEPDWVIGTSIGAINAGLIAGNKPEHRLERLTEFWMRMQHSPMTHLAASTPLIGNWAANVMTMADGVQGFFSPNPWAFLTGLMPMAAETAGYYTIAPLEKTLTELIDLDVLNACATRLTVGAAHVQTGEMKYFDSRDKALSIRHIMASGALPPAFPAVRLDGELYWDGGILSNTPVEAVFDDNPRRSGLVFSVHIWSPNGPEPDTIQKVLSRQKDLQYASRASAHIARQKQIHKLRHVISELAMRLPEDQRDSAEAKELRGYGCLTRMHVVRLLAPPLAGEDHTKDIDFSRSGIKARWDAGYADTARVLGQAPWTHEFDPLEGFILHEAEAGLIVKEG